MKQQDSIDEENAKEIYILRIYRQESTSKSFSGTIERVGDHCSSAFTSPQELMDWLLIKSFEKEGV